MKILVTGAAGFIGSHTCERLQLLGHDVIGLDNFSPYYNVALKKHTAQILKNKGIAILNVDLRTAPLHEYIKEGIDVVYHLAAQSGIAATSTYDDYYSNNVLATQRLLSLFETFASKPYFINIATSSIYGLEATMTEDQAPNPASWYGVTKLAAEQLVLAYCRRGLLKGTSLRLFSVYGPRERPDKLYTRLINCGINKKIFSLYRGSEKHLRSFTYVHDIIDGMLAVLKNQEICNTQIFNLGTEVENSTETGIRTVEKLLNTHIQKEIKPVRPGDQLRTKANITKAKRILEYHPKTNLQDGLKDQIAWFKEHF